MRLEIPQIIIISLMFIRLGIELALHGEEAHIKHNFWASLIAFMIEFLILYKGGFF